MNIKKALKGVVFFTFATTHTNIKVLTKTQHDVET